MSSNPPYDDSPTLLSALLRSFYDEPAPRVEVSPLARALAEMPPPPKNVLSAVFNDLPPPSENAMAAWSGLSALGAFTRTGGLGELPPPPRYAPQPAFECWRREAAWIRTAGHVDAPDAHDHNNNWLYRNAKQGQPGCWHAAHIHDDALGGPDVPWNYRAQKSSDNMAEGALLGNAMKRYRDGQ